MWIISVYRPIGHLITTGQMQLLLSDENPEREILGPCVIRNLPHDSAADMTAKFVDIIAAHGADLGPDGTGPVDSWKTNTLDHIVAQATITQHGSFSGTPEDVLRATSASVTGLTADGVQALLRPFVTSAYILRLEDVRVVDPPVPIRRHHISREKRVAFLGDQGIARKVRDRSGDIVVPIEPVVVVP
jgi:hypothetical protein